MLPLAPMPVIAFGPLWYAQLYGSLCRALAPPWLDPWWLIRAADNRERRVPPCPAPAMAPPCPEPSAEAPGEDTPPAATIIPFELARARVAAIRAASQGPSR
jgi:hypothetical protein